MAEEKKKINVMLDHGDVFYTDGLTISFNPNKFIFDFKQGVPRTDPTPGGGDQRTIVIKHNVLMMDIPLAKALSEHLSKNIKNYEKQFGKIELPKPKKQTTKKSTIEKNYIG